MPLLLTLIPLAIGAQIQIAQPPRLRTVLANGLTVLVERRPGAKELYVDLFAAARGTEEMPGNNGRRHLLEHIEALGVKGDLDSRLESSGAFMVAQTTRDALAFEFSLRPTDLPLALSSIKEVIAGPTIDSASIAREANLIAEEGALRSGSSLASSAAWLKMFGGKGLDPYGDAEIIAATKPSDLEKLRNQTFAANNLVVVVSGDVELDAATKAVRDALALTPSIKPTKATGPAIEPGTGSVEFRGSGQYRAAAVPGFRSPVTAATLAAALALANELDNAQVIYTPSVRPGIVMVGVSDGRLNDAFTSADPAYLFEVGRRLAIRWVQSRLSRAGRAAEFRGMLLAQAIDVRPETMLENLQGLKFEEFKEAFDTFRNGGVTVEGR